MARGRLDGAGLAEDGEGRFALHAVGVVAGGYEQRSRGVGADAASGQQRGVSLFAQAEQSGVEFGGLGAQRPVVAYQGPQRLLGRRLGYVGDATVRRYPRDRGCEGPAAGP